MRKFNGYKQNIKDVAISVTDKMFYPSIGVFIGGTVLECMDTSPRVAATGMALLAASLSGALLSSEVHYEQIYPHSESKA